MIRFLSHNEIDKDAYDACIRNSTNEMIYVYSWYLDMVSPDWSLLATDNYAQVMPLPGRKKFGIRYLFVPRYLQQSGVFGRDLTPAIVESFIHEIPSSFKIVDLKLNEQNLLSSHHIPAVLHTNYILALERDYATTSKKYNRNCRRNLTKAHAAGLTFPAGITSKEFAAFIQRHLQEEIEGLAKRDIILLEELTGEGMRRKEAEIVAVLDASGEICAAALFFFTRRRVIFSVCASSPEGKRNQAMTLLVDHQIQKYSGRFGQFDFSGSEIKGIAYFNSTFGAQPVHYPVVHINRLNLIERILSGKT
jgi:hypothetical protein